MTTRISIPFMMTALLILSACNGSKPAAGGNVSMRDMEVVDGTANDSMVDLDNAAQDGTLLANAGALPGEVGMGARTAVEGSATTAPANNASTPRSTGGNSSASE